MSHDNPTPREIKMHEDDIREARSVSLMIWGLLTLIQFNLAAATIWLVMLSEETPIPVGKQWTFPVLCLFGMTAIPLAFYMRGKIFSAFWRGEVVEPWDFVKGMTLPWLATTVTTALALSAAVFAHTLLPNVVIAASMACLMLVLYPTGDVMERPVGKISDPSIFKHPS